MIQVFRNTNKVIERLITNDDGTAFDLTSKVVEIFIKRKTVVHFYAISSAQGSPITFVNPTTGGQYELALKPEHTVNLQNGLYEYGVLVRAGTEIVYIGGEEVLLFS